jgi:non-ribosomal peptide synthetase-like protein
MEGNISTLRLLILGGEVCPPDLVKRWWRPGRRVVNTYGPTEATVVATYADCSPGQPVTIGQPLPNYGVCILDERLRPVARGGAGELCIGGVGVARGYVKRPELAREKFIELDLGACPGRFYRTGDLARWLPNGEIEFLGRMDSQVKIRGFRVELAEIESVLMECPGVQTAAVAVREDQTGVHQLVGYVVLRLEAQFEEATERARLRQRLPPYMVPVLLEILPAIPMSTSGKVDRKSLPAPSRRPEAARDAIVHPRNDIEEQLVAVWNELFTPSPVSVEHDFFLDLGGHSLLAARMVSKLRNRPAFSGISMADVYGHPTIATLAAEFGSRQRAEAKAASTSYQPIPFWRHFFCGAGQFVCLFFILSFFALQWLTPYLTYTILIEEEYGFVAALLGAFASLIFLYPVMLMVPIAVKWALIGRYRPGAYPLWGWFYFRWWFSTTLEAAVPVNYLTGTPLMNIYLRLMGAKIGANVHVATDSLVIYDLLAIGDDSSINADSNLLGYTVEDGLLKIGAITIGKRCFVGARAAVRQNAVMEEDSALEDLSLLQAGATIRRGETWLGSPATRVDERPAKHAPERPSLHRRFGFGLLHAAGLLIFPALVVGPLFPGIVVMNELNYMDQYYWYLFVAPLAALSFIVLLALEIVALKWLLLGRVEAGEYPLHSFFHFRKWFADQTMNLSLEILGPLYASIYLAPWYRALGAKLGRGAEISTASFISPDLLSIGEESFIADNVSLGAARVRNGTMKLGRNEIGRRSFIGNSALLPPDTAIGDSVLIGCLSTPPPNPADALREDGTWLGSPPILLPRRERSTQFSARTTFEPTMKLRLLRAAIEFIRVIAPSTGFIVLLSLMFSVLLLLRDDYSLGETLLFCPALFLACAVAAAAVTIALKWILVQRYRPGEQPLWSTFVWRNELLNAVHEHLAEPLLVGPLTGTPFICWYFRLLGAKIGRRVYLETSDFSEFDLVRIGDEAMLNADCTIQTHLFEDRVMKMDDIRIGARAKVGAGSLVLYGTRMEEGAALGDLSLLMKGEVLPARTEWEGIPARPYLRNDSGKILQICKERRGVLTQKY